MLALLLLALLAPTPALASEPAPSAQASASEVSRIQGVIDDQLAAFQRDDAAGAWKHVAPSLRAKFGSPDTFLRMVREGYPPVHRMQRRTFEELEVLPTGELGQWMEITGANGQRVRALYLMERQPDGSWRTSGCLLFQPGPSEPSV
jgi:ketosteroid isomerase-like protein